MSGSDEETFESAEEGEDSEKKSAIKSARENAGKSKGRAATSAGKSSGASGKQKSKQQQQQRKKSKGQPNSVKHEKEPTTENKPSESEGDKKEPLAVSSVDTVASSAVASPDLDAACHKGEPVTVSFPIKDSEQTAGEKSDQSNTDSQPKSEGQQPTDTTVTTKLEMSDKSAGDIRKNLKSSTEKQGLDNPSEQAIGREAGGDLSASAAEDGGEQKGKKEGEGGEHSGGGWGWGWGSSILTAATNSLETFTSQVGEGLTTIIDTVESSLGVPGPEELARADLAVELGAKADETETVTAQPTDHVTTEKQIISHAEQDQTEQGASAAEDKKVEEVEESKTGEMKAQGGGGWLSGWGNITNMGKSFVTKGQTLMNSGFEKAEHLAAGGLDILETIGKKTYTTLTDHDPGLRRAREFLHLNDEKPSLSSMLKDAREQAEERAKREQESEEVRKCSFAALFEDSQGLAHLEALEMLSNQSERKVQSLLSAMAESDVEAVRSQLVEIKDTFQQAIDGEEKEQGDTEHDFNKLVTENLSELHLGTAPDKLNKVQETVRQWIADFYTHEDHSGVSSAKEVQQRAVQSLADVTSKAVEQFHKAGELVLMQRDADKTYVHRAQSLAKLAHVLVTEVDILATKFSQCLNKIAEENNSAEEVNPMVTNVYLEASNASGYIQDAFQLLLPVIQHAALQSALSAL